MLRGAHRGVSLIEAMVVLVISGLLLAMAMPSFSDWIAGSRVRATAESMLAGLQYAKSEAASRNTQVRFQLTNNLTSTCVLSTTGTNWIVDLVDADATVDSVANNCNAAPDDTTPPSILQVRASTEVGTGVRVIADASAVVFNGFGRIVPTPASAININITPRTGSLCAGAGGNVTCLRIVNSTSGQVRMCNPNPNLAAGDPQAC